MFPKLHKASSRFKMQKTFILYLAFSLLLSLANCTSISEGISNTTEQLLSTDNAKAMSSFENSSSDQNVVSPNNNILMQETKQILSTVQETYSSTAIPVVAPSQTTAAELNDTSSMESLSTPVFGNCSAEVLNPTKAHHSTVPLTSITVSKNDSFQNISLSISNISREGVLIEERKSTIKNTLPDKTAFPTVNVLNDKPSSGGSVRNESTSFSDIEELHSSTTYPKDSLEQDFSTGSSFMNASPMDEISSQDSSAKEETMNQMNSSNILLEGLLFKEYKSTINRTILDKTSIPTVNVLNDKPSSGGSFRNEFANSSAIEELYSSMTYPEDSSEHDFSRISTGISFMNASSSEEIVPLDSKRMENRSGVEESMNQLIFSDSSRANLAKVLNGSTPVVDSINKHLMTLKKWDSVNSTKKNFDAANQHPASHVVNNIFVIATSIQEMNSSNSTVRGRALLDEEMQISDHETKNDTFPSKNEDFSVTSSNEMDSSIANSSVDATFKEGLAYTKELNNSSLSGFDSALNKPSIKNTIENISVEKLYHRNDSPMDVNISNSTTAIDATFKKEITTTKELNNNYGSDFDSTLKKLSNKTIEIKSDEKVYRHDSSPIEQHFIKKAFVASSTNASNTMNISKSHSLDNVFNKDQHSSTMAFEGMKTHTESPQNMSPKQGLLTLSSNMKPKNSSTNQLDLLMQPRNHDDIYAEAASIPNNELVMHLAANHSETAHANETMEQDAGHTQGLMQLDNKNTNSVTSSNTVENSNLLNITNQKLVLAEKNNSLELSMKSLDNSEVSNNTAAINSTMVGHSSPKLLFEVNNTFHVDCPVAMSVVPNHVVEIGFSVMVDYLKQAELPTQFEMALRKALNEWQCNSIVQTSFHFGRPFVFSWTNASVNGSGCSQLAVVKGLMLDENSRISENFTYAFLPEFRIDQVQFRNSESCIENSSGGLGTTATVFLALFGISFLPCIFILFIKFLHTNAEKRQNLLRSRSPFVMATDMEPAHEADQFSSTTSFYNEGYNDRTI